MPLSKTGILHNIVPVEGLSPFKYRVTSKTESGPVHGEVYNDIYCENRESASDLIAEWNSESVDFDFVLL